MYMYVCVCVRMYMIHIYIYIYMHLYLCVRVHSCKSDSYTWLQSSSAACAAIAWRPVSVWKERLSHFSLLVWYWTWCMGHDPRNSHEICLFVQVLLLHGTDSVCMRLVSVWEEHYSSISIAEFKKVMSRSIKFELIMLWPSLIPQQKFRRRYCGMVQAYLTIRSKYFRLLRVADWTCHAREIGISDVMYVYLIYVYKRIFF